MNANIFRIALALAVALPPLSVSAAAAPQRVGCLWEREADSPIARFEAGTMPIDGKLYCFGGFYNQAIQATRRSDYYDPLTDTWTQIADLPTPVTHIGVVREGRNVWMLGGFVGDNPGVATSDVWIYDIDLDQWTAGPPLPRPIAAGGAAMMGRNLHYYGGCEADRNSTTGDHWVLDLDNQVAGWQSLAPMPQPRCHLSGAALGGELWAVGGQIRHDSNPLDTRWVHAYDPMADTWRQGPLLPEPRSHFEPGTFVENGNLYISGGKNLTIFQTVLAGMLQLDPVLGEWSFLPPLPNPRYGPGVQLVSGRLYAANGAALFNNPQTDLYSRDWNATYPNPLRINCGGPEVVASTGSCCWCGDVGFENGTVASFNPAADIANTDDDDVFDQQREGDVGSTMPLVYRFAMGDGFFRVKFFMAERDMLVSGERILDLEIEAESVADQIDLTLNPGFEVAMQRGFDVEVTDGELAIVIRARPGQRPLIAALEIEKLGPMHFEFECSNPANSTGSSSLMDFEGNTSVALDDLAITASPVPAGQFGLFVQAAGAGSFPIAGGGGTLCLGAPLFRLPVVQAQGQVLRYKLDITNPPPSAAPIVGGSTWRFQAWHRDSVGAGYGLSNAMKLVFTP